MTKAGALAFVGGGEWQQGCSFDSVLLEASNTSEVLVVTAAAAYEQPERVLESASSWFGSLGAAVRSAGILTRGDAEDAAKADVVRAARFIYLSDGSALHLRSVLKDSLVWRAIVDAWIDGATIVGSSASATVLADPMVDPRGGTFTLGLGLVRNLAVVPHWERWSDDRSRRMSHLTPPGAIVAEVEDHTALIRWPDGRWETQGVGTVTLKLGQQTVTLNDIEPVVETVPVVA